MHNCFVPTTNLKGFANKGTFSTTLHYPHVREFLEGKITKLMPREGGTNYIASMPRWYICRFLFLSGLIKNNIYKRKWKTFHYLNNLIDEKSGSMSLEICQNVIRSFPEKFNFTLTMLAYLMRNILFLFLMLDLLIKFFFYIFFSIWIPNMIVTVCSHCT